MSSMSVDGLVSGLDTTSLINSLMQLEAGPQTQLKSKLTATQSTVSAYQAVNSKLASVKTATGTLAKPETWSSPAGTSTSSHVTVSTAPLATPGNLSFDVTSLAAAHSLATGTFSTLADLSGATPLSLSGTKGGRSFTITPTSSDPAAVADAISRATFGDGTSVGLRASTIQVAPGSYRMQVTAKNTGSANAFTLDGLGSMTTVKAAADARVDLGGGLVVQSSTNTFADLLPGTSFTVGAVESGVQVSVATNASAVSDKVSGFVDSINAALKEMSTDSAYNATSKTSGPLTGNSTIARLQQSLLDKVSNSVGTLGSPAAAGIQLDSNGKVTFDAAKFQALLASDPAKAQALVQGVASRLGAVATSATDTTSGSVTTAIQGQNSLIKDLNSRISDWDGRLALRKRTLQVQFTAMEKALSTMKSQSSYLGSQISAMSTK